MQNLFRRFTLTIDYMERESNKEKNIVYLLRWKCTTCGKNDRIILHGQITNFQDYAHLIKCQCRKMEIAT